MKTGKGKRKAQKTTIISHGKKKRWAKGHSSDSNPATRVYRDAARNYFYHPPSDEKELKMRDMQLLENMDINLKDGDRDHTGSVSEADTVATKLSAITNCTNPTFDKVHRIWKSGSKLHADVLTVLASVTDAIKSKGGKENEVEYFAALLNPLADPEYSSNLIAATCYLLNLVIRKVSKPILIQKFRPVAEIISSVVKRTQISSDERGDSDGHQTSILRYSLSSLAVLLEAHPSTMWLSKPYNIIMVKIFETVLKFAICEKPRVRKSAHKAIVQIVINGSTLPAVVSESCGDFCVGILERYGGDGRRKRAEADDALHVLNLLQHVLHRFANSDLKRTVETIFKLLTLSDSLTAATAVHCLYMLFRNRPSTVSLPADLNAKMIMAIYDFQPSNKDGKAWSNWITLATEAHGCLLERDLELAGDYVPKLIQTVSLCLVDSEQAEIIQAAAGCMKKIYSDFTSDLVKCSKKIELMERCLESLERLLQGQYYTIWSHAFNLLATFFQSIGPIASSLKNFERSLKTIAELRESESFPCKLPAEQAIGAAVRHVGPEEVVKAIPLGLNTDAPSLCSLDFPRSWLLPVLRMNIRGAKLGYFASYFLPLAIKLEQRVKEFRADMDKDVECRVLESLELQIWELLPSFCTKPTDVLDPVTARALGAALIGRPKLRLSVLTGIRKLLQQENDVAKKTMGKYAGNYLNILLQLYVRKEEKIEGDYNDEGVRLAVLQTISSYLTVTPSNLITSYLEEVSKRLRASNESVSQAVDQKCRLMDVVILLVPYLDIDRRRSIYELVVETNATAEKRIQKKCWRVMEKLCSGNSEAARDFISGDLSGAIRTYLQSDLITAAPATKACKLRCLLSMLESMQGSGNQDDLFILSVLPDAIRCFQGTSVKARKAAAKFIIKAVTVMASWRKDIDGALRVIYDKIMTIPDSKGGDKLATQDLTGSIIAVRLLCYEFRNDISTDLVSSILGNICHHLRSDVSRFVTQACIEFLKTFVGCFPEITVGQFLDTIVSSLCNQNEDCMRYCRRLTRKVMAKLVKRFSYVAIRKFVPPTYEKQLNNIRKLVARSEKRAAVNEKKTRGGTAASIGSSDDETGTVFTSFTNLSRPETIADLLKDTSDEEEMEEDRPSQRGAKAPSVWLREGDEEEVVDFMDKKFVQQIVTTKPKSIDSNRLSITDESIKNRGFKTASDGRLVITLEPDDKDGQKGRKRKRQDSLDSEGDVVRQPVEKADHSEVDQKGCEDDMEGTSTYVPGGRGIHRQLAEGKRGAKRVKLDKKSKKGVDPYTYVPLDKKALNKRKQAKMSVQLKHLVQGAKKGATKGSKGKMKRMK